jgi:hypothetical protein
MKDTDSSNTLSTMASSTCAANDSSEFLCLSPGKRPIRKVVSWGQSIDNVKFVECFVNGPEGTESIWYSGKELGDMRKQEIKKLKAAQKVAGKDSIESDEMTWRGLEDIRDSWCRVEKSSRYTDHIVEHLSAQFSQGYFNPEEIRTVARAESKAERARVYNLAVRDAEGVGIVVAKRSTVRKSRSNVTIKSKGELNQIPSREGFKTIRSSGSLAFGMNKVSSFGSLKKGVTRRLNFQWKKNDPATLSV